jgi:hypothetical protein
LAGFIIVLNDKYPLHFGFSSTQPTTGTSTKSSKRGISSAVQIR